MNIADQLDQLEYREIIRRMASPELEYSFKHTLTQETTYQSLLKPQRRSLHGAVAQAYEELYPDRLDEFAALLAEHYAQAGDDAKTLVYAARAGDAAGRIYANAEAIAYYSQALAIATRMPHASAQPGDGSTAEGTLRDLYLKRGRAFELSGQYKQALDNYEEMKALARARADEGLELEALMACATLHSIPGAANNPLLARGLATQALALAQELRLRAAEAKIYWNLMLLENWGGGNPQRAVEFGEKSLALARELDLHEQLAFTLHDLSMAHMFAGHMDQGWAMQNEAGELWRESHNLPMYAESVSRTVIMHVNAGDFDAAIARGREAYELTQTIGNVIGEGLAALSLSHVYAALGQFDKAFEYGADASRYSQESAVPSMRLSIQNQAAWAYGSLGMIEKGIEIAQDGLRQATSTIYGEDHYRMELSRSSFEATLIRLELLKGNLTKAQEIFRRAPLATRDDTFFMSLFDGDPIFLAISELRLAAGDYVSAGETVDQFLAGQARAPARPFLPGANFLKGKILLAQGRAEAAVHAWQTARAEAEAMNLRPILWPVLIALAESHDRQDHHTEAIELLDEARTVIQYIADHSPADLRASFLALPRVRKVMAGAGVRERTGITHESR